MRDKCARTPDQVPLTGTLSDSEKEKSQSKDVSRIFSSQQEKLCDRIVIRTKPVLTDHHGFQVFMKWFCVVGSRGFRRGTQKRGAFSLRPLLCSPRPLRLNPDPLPRLLILIKAPIMLPLCFMIQSPSKLAKRIGT